MMTTTTSDGARFLDDAYLRRVLLRLYAKGEHGWRCDPEAEALIRLCIERFTPLCRKHGLDPADGGAAAFEAMRNPSVVFGDDPWAVIVCAVQTSLAAWEFAQDALCSEQTARRGGLSGCCPYRYGDQADDVFDHHPAFITSGGPGLDAAPSIGAQARRLARLLAIQGWPLGATMTAVDVVLGRLAEAGSRPACYEQLRRESRWCAVSGLPIRSWTGLLRLLLGTPADKAGVTDKGQGILLRLALGETLGELAADEVLCEAIRADCPGVEHLGAA